jgi:small subunit ribosomal protein S8
MINDNISDFLTRIRNASLAKHIFTIVSFTKINLAILKIFLSEGYISNFQIEENNIIKKNKLKTEKTIKIFLKYKGWWFKKSFFSIIKRISKPGKRIFSNYKKFTNVMPLINDSQGIAFVNFL